MLQIRGSKQTRDQGHGSLIGEQAGGPNGNAADSIGGFFLGVGPDSLVNPKYTTLRPTEDPDHAAENPLNTPLEYLKGILETFQRAERSSFRI